MQYAVATEITALLPQPVLGMQLVTGSSHPVNLLGVDRYLTLVESEFDAAAAGAGYSVPVSSSATSAFAYAQMVIGHGVMARVLDQINPGSKTAAAFEADFRQAIQDIRAGRQPLLASNEAGETGRSFPQWGENLPPRVTASYDW
jgi:hypothetical protein